MIKMRSTKLKSAFNTIKECVQGNKVAKALSLLAALVMPVCVVDMGTTGIITDLISPYYLLFFGFYGSILLCLSWERKWLWLKIILVVINALINGFIIFVAFMGGAFGPLLALLQMIIPIIPWILIFG